MSNEGGKGGGGGRRGEHGGGGGRGGLRGVNRECISFCLQSYPFPSFPLKKHTKQQEESANRGQETDSKELAT